MNADAYFTIGKTHEICEDYALAGEDFAALSDGCSGSPRTDFGARFLALGAELWLQDKNKTSGEIESIPQNALRIAQQLAEAASLPSACLDATLAYIFPDNKHIHVLLAGDGVVAARLRSGGVEIYCIEYPSGAPAYLSYALDSKRRKMYLKQDQGSELTIHVPTMDISPVVHQKTGLEPHRFMLETSVYDLVAVMSDGVMSFQRPITNDLGTSRHFEDVPTADVVNSLMAVKSSKGKFVARRCKRFLKECAKKGWHHNDDLSMAALYIG